MKGNKILVTSKPRGVFEDVYISGTPKPGTTMQLSSTASVGGIFTMSIATYDAHGNQRMPAVLLEKDQENGVYSDAYVDGDMGRVYFPAAGEKLNMLLQDVSGTGDDQAIGDLFMVEKDTGKLIATTGSPESESYVLLETVTDPMADHWEMCMFTGY